MPYDPSLPVTTAWDLGVGDSTAIWFFQTNGAEVFIIDYYEASGVGLDHYVKVLKEKPYVYTDVNIFPQDIGVQELSSGKSRLDLLAGLGVRGRVLPRASVDSGIAAVRLLLPRCRFDKEKCAKGLEALRQYQRAWDDQRKDFQPKPLHDWTSHAADAFRYLACGIKEKKSRLERPFVQAQSSYRDYDPLA